MEVKMIGLDEVRPSPFQPREAFPKEEIQQLAATIKKVGLLQPIAVRKNGETYQIISGERRWRACQFAGLKQIPAIIKDITDSQMMIESIIENVHRKDLEPLEKARGLAEVYKLGGFESHGNVASKLRMIEGILNEGNREGILNEEEKRIKEIADTIGLSYDYQYRLLSQLRLSPEEQKRVTELKLGYGKIASISTIEDKEDRRDLIEIAPKMERETFRKVSKIVRKAPKSIKKAVLKREIEPDIAEEILNVEEPAIQEKALDIAKKGIYAPEGFKTRLEQLTKPRIELPTERFEVQVFNKAIWNLSRMDKFDFYTIGYEKKTLEQFLELLKKAGVRTLVDVRAVPRSMFREEFNRDNLVKELGSQGFKYRHFAELGVPTEIRGKLAESGDFELFNKWYDEHVLASGKLDSEDFKSLDYPIAIMCVEFDPTRCHRHRIALALEKRGLRGIDL
jgi:ParB/RepB/Spo0J family partition protein